MVSVLTLRDEHIPGVSLRTPLGASVPGTGRGPACAGFAQVELAAGLGSWAQASAHASKGLLLFCPTLSPGFV